MVEQRNDFNNRVAQDDRDFGWFEELVREWCGAEFDPSTQPSEVTHHDCEESSSKTSDQ